MEILLRFIARIWPGKVSKKSPGRIKQDREYWAKVSAAQRKAAQQKDAEKMRQAADRRNCLEPPAPEVQEPEPGPEEIETLKWQEEKAEAYKAFFPEIAEWIVPIGLDDEAFYPNAFRLKPGWNEAVFKAFINDCWESLVRVLGTEKRYIDEFMEIRFDRRNNSQRVWINDVLIWCYVHKKFLCQTPGLDVTRETFLVLNRAGWSTFRISRAAINAKTPQELISKYWHLDNEAREAV